MSWDPFERVALARTDVRVTRLGLGGAEIGGLYQAISEEEAVALVGRAWDMGIRHFDTAPLYGYGNSERRMGRALAGRPRDTYALSTKVGRLLYPVDEVPAGADVDRQEFQGEEDFFYRGVPAVRVVFDYSYEGVMRSVEESLERLGIGRVDILYIHDPDHHWEEAIGGAYPALHRLRSEGAVGAIGAGMNQAEMLARFAREGDFDCFMLAGRYTLLDQSALGELLPLCLEKGIAIVLAGVMNSGILADPRPGSRFNYLPAGQAWLERARRLEAVCRRHGVPLKAAAVQFPLAHPAVACLVAGVRRREHLEEYPELLRFPIPGGLWAELWEEGLIPTDAPVPGEAA
ncbi:MAG: aldo/keto reductase [Actinomycetota bacterium]|nr:aldo/keto reductase [Actinomycetota bacterium]